MIDGMMTKETDDAPAVGQRRVKRSSGFVEEVFEIIRADLMSLRIPADSRISIDNLARELGVSQTPIREALSMLEAVGLVTRKRFVGYCSAPQLNTQQLNDLYELRLLIEPAAAALAAERMSDTQLDQIRELARSMGPGDSRTSYDRFAVQDSQLHDLIAAASGNSLIQDGLARLHVHLHIFRLRFHSEVTSEARTEHATLIDALSRRNPAEAESAMRRHIQRSYDRMVAYTQP
jgi:DNA-binding GntR family transcriptional regulator